MKTRNAMALTALVVLMSATVAKAAEPSAPPAAAAVAPSAAPKGEGKGDGNGENFAARKEKILERLSKHESEFQKRQSCVQAATDRESLKACFPNKGWGGHGGGGRGCHEDGGEMKN